MRSWLAIPVILFHAHALAAENVVLNGDFSAVDGGRPTGWETSGNPETVAQTLQAVKDGGNTYARLACTRCDGQGGWTHAMICQVGGVRLVKGKSYRFSCRARAEGLAGRNVQVAIQDTDGWHACGLNTTLPLARDWQEFQRVFKAARTAHQSTRLQFWFNETGTLCLDEVSIVELPEQAVEFTHVVPEAVSKNLVPNGSFEVGSWGWSSLGKGAGWGNLSKLHGRVEEPGGAHGRRFLRVPLGGEHTPVLQFDYYEPVVRRELQPLGASVGWIPVQPGQACTLSCSMRADTPGVRALMGVRAKDPDRSRWDWQSHTRHVQLTTSWKRYTHTFTPKYRYVYVTIGPDLAREASVRVDIDAVQLEKGAKATDFAPHSPVEVSVEPGEPSGIFTWDADNTLTIRGHNHGDKARTLRVRLTLTDFFDKALPLGGAELDLKGGGSAEKVVRLPKGLKGFYGLTAQTDAAGGEALCRVRLAFVPPRIADDSVLGINHAFPSPHLIDLARQAGIAWYRDWSLKWQHVEPRSGQMQWEVADPQIDRVKDRGALVLALLPPFPSADWISEAPESARGKAYPEVRLPSAWAPRDPARLGEFVGKAVTRYKDRVKVWEFLNEPIYTTYALPGKDKASLDKYGGKRYEPTDYVRLLAVASAAMKKADPACRVVGGIGGGPDTLTREVIDAGCLEHVDIFNVHTYPGMMSPEGFFASMDKLLARMDEGGGRKPIWVTEFSYYAVDDLPRKPFVPDSDSWAEQRLLDSERQCAEYTVRFVVVMLSRGAEKVFIHSGASGEVNFPSPECCLFGHGGAPRRVLPAVAVLTHLLGPSPRFAAEARPGRDAYAQAFETGKQAVLVLWSSAGELTVRPPGGDGVKALDIMGRALKPGPITLGETPMYIVAPPGTARKLVASFR